MQAVLVKLFGSDVTATLLGLAAAVALSIAAYLQALPPEVGQGWKYVAAGLILIGRFVERKSKQPAPVQPPPAP